MYRTHEDSNGLMSAGAMDHNQKAVSLAAF